MLSFEKSGLKLSLVSIVLLGLHGCASAPHSVSDESSRPANSLQPAAWVADAVAGDGPGWRKPKSAPQPVKVENLPKSRRGNPTEYTVGGVRYPVIDNAAGYIEQGKASWYGRKFHGRETSSGEVYDMYALTAAHKHLPLPTFVRVTRTDTGQSIVVKVNDRGPFVPGRIIDLSYQAATTLGVVDDGTAPVVIEALSSHLPQGVTSVAAASNPAPQSAETVAVPKPVIEVPASAVSENYLQIGAFSQSANAQNLVAEVAHAMPMPVRIDHNDAQALFRVWVGPIETELEQRNAVAALRSQGITNFTMVTSMR